MRDSRKTVTLLMAAAVLCAGWAGFAQVQDKSKARPAPTTKKAAETAKPATDAAKSVPAGAKDAKKPSAASQPVANESADEAAIRKGADAFITAYNAHDAKAVSELFALKAEFTDEEGNLIKGREAIEQDFSKMFTEKPACRINIAIDSIRVLTPNIAVEEGIVRGRPDPDEEENVSSYVVVHVKVDGRWVIASVSDYETEPDNVNANDKLQQLAWMVGDWLDESPDSILKSSCRWDNSGNYLL
ncbi:MAG TPA: SgcJ/EcaC family oxidoreductase, partial [Planctomycetaceae bacterium]|nr:SgcJ/EcaC family oxidoreductase [Planctomycetaceae bacterium]